MNLDAYLSDDDKYEARLQRKGDDDEVTIHHHKKGTTNYCIAMLRLAVTLVLHVNESYCIGIKFTCKSFFNVCGRPFSVC